MGRSSDTSSNGNSGAAKTILAAGCVVYRRTGPTSGDVELLLAHRPKYDDWDFPKGHVDRGETEREAAVRETFEEVCVEGSIEAELPTVYYQVKGKDKSIRWWLMQFTQGAFEPNDEVDEIAWVPLASVADRLSYTNTASLLPYVNRLLLGDVDPSRPV